MLLLLASTLAAPPGTGTCKSPTKAPMCYGLGEYAVGTGVDHTKCPQLNITDIKNNPTGVLTRYCLINGNVSSGQACFTDPEAYWEPKIITGIGINGYWTDYSAKSGDDKYGWVDGVIPDMDPNASTLVVGMEVLCRDPVITKPDGTNATCSTAIPDNVKNGCWMQGQLVDPSTQGTWVCKLDDKTKQLMPFTKTTNIRPLCFAKTSHSGGSKGCDCMDPACPTCCPYCSIGITSAGHLCPDHVNLAMDVLSFNKTLDVFEEGQVTGIYYTNTARTDLKYEITVNGQTIADASQWGPHMGTYILPKLPSAGITNTSFGRYVLCPAPNAPNGTYKAGTIFNTPLQSADAKFHVYACDVSSSMNTCDAKDMLDTCYPTTL